jgi:hypothetical protein
MKKKKRTEAEARLWKAFRELDGKWLTKELLEKVAKKYRVRSSAGRAIGS